MEAKGRVEELVRRIVDAIGVPCEVVVVEQNDHIRVDLRGDELGLLIGHHGQTIDAIQHLAYRAAFDEDEPRRRVEVDASGYRARRAALLEEAAGRAADEAIRSGQAVELEAMNAGERKLIHEYLRLRGDVETHSEGREPERRLVVEPLEG